MDPTNRQLPVEIGEIYDGVCDFTVTFPFNHKKVPWQVYEDALNRTKRRWDWFADAKKADKQSVTDLGTLRYLPFEIQKQVLIYFITQYIVDKGAIYFDGWGFTMRTRGNFRYLESGSGRNIPILNVSRRFSATSAINLLQASRKLKRPFCDGFFSSFAFRVHCPKTFEALVSSPLLTQAEKNHRVHISVEASLSAYHSDQRRHPRRSGMSELKDWHDAIDAIPSNLGRLVFQLDSSGITPEGWEMYLPEFVSLVQKAKRKVSDAKVSVRCSILRIPYHLSGSGSEEEALYNAMIREMEQLTENLDEVIIRHQRTSP